MATHKLKTLNIRGQQYEVSVNDGGEFFADVSDETLRAPSLDELKQKLMVATKQKSIKMAIEFEVLNANGSTRLGIVTGIHVNSNLLVKYADASKTEQERSYSFRVQARPLTELERAEWATICRDKRSAEKREADFRKRVDFDVRGKAREEMARLTGETPDIEL